MGRSTRRGPWLPIEDGALLQLVRKQGPNNWVQISQQMQHRSPKQCRERYHQNLKASLNHDPISNEEGELIEHLVQEMGKRWAEIARRLGNRSDNAVKNWWNGSMNRRKRNITHSTARAVGPRQLPISATAPLRAESNHRPKASYNLDSRPFSSPNHFDSTGFHIELPRPGYMSAASGNQLSRNGIEHHISPRPAEHLHSSPQPDLRGLPIVSPSLSAPDSLQATSSAAFMRHLQVPPPSHGRRPSHLEQRSSSYADWQLPRLHEATAISPSATEYSNAPSFTPAPSLISDNQSHCSISPKTMSSPRPGMPAPIDTSNQNWHAGHRQNNYIAYPQSDKGMQDEGYVSAIAQSALNEPASENFPLDPSLRRPVSYLDSEPKVVSQVRPASSPAEKDSRMTVSRLLD